MTLLTLFLSAVVPCLSLPQVVTSVQKSEVPQTGGPTYSPHNTTAPLTTVLVTSGLAAPVFVTAPPGESQRLFVLEQQTGSIRIVQNGVLLAAPFLNVLPLIGFMNTGEQGLLGMAFHPDYANNGYFFINYTEKTNGNTVVARYQVSAVNPNVADPTSAKIIIVVQQPFANHNGGMLAFGPQDGYLYIGMGDGGSDFDPNGNAQNLNSLLGKMLRIDVNTPAGIPYLIPPTNPFAGSPTSAPEIWSFGLRNPWRFSFDQLTSDLWIADVGQGSIEEVDFQYANDAGGKNYGWRCYEGTMSTGFSGCTASTNVEFPIYQYPHTLPGCAIIGGFVYRGFQIPDLRGSYFFADWCKSKIFTFQYVGGAVINFQDRTAELVPSDGVSYIGPISSFGQDGVGELYICDYQGGEIFKVVPAAPIDPPQGIQYFGTGTYGCLGTELLTSNTSAIINDPYFTINCTNAPPNSSGLLIVTDAADFIGNDQLGLNVATYLDFLNSTELYIAEMYSSSNGGSQLVFPIPNAPAAIGSDYTFQAFWSWPTGNCHHPKGYFSSSSAITVTILP